MLSVARYETPGFPIFMNPALAKRLKAFLPYFGRYVTAPCAIVTARDFLKSEISTDQNGFISYDIDAFILRHDGKLADFPYDSAAQIEPAIDDLCIYNTSSDRQKSYLIFAGQGLKLSVARTVEDIACLPRHILDDDKIQGSRLSWLVLSLLHEIGHTHEEISTNGLVKDWNEEMLNEILADSRSIPWYREMRADGLPLCKNVPEQFLQSRSLAMLTHHLYQQSHPAHEQSQFVHFSAELFDDTSAITSQHLKTMYDCSKKLIQHIVEMNGFISSLDATSQIELTPDEEKLICSRRLYSNPQHLTPYIHHLLQTEPLRTEERRLCNLFLNAAAGLNLRPPVEELHEIEDALANAAAYKAMFGKRTLEHA